MTVKERPIIFSGPMVRAILEGRKTQTRRVVKPQPESPPVIAPEICWMQGRVTCIWPAPYTLDDGTRPDHYAVCPYGQPGDRLWVREAWQEVPYGPHRDWPGVPDMRPKGICENNRVCVVIWKADGPMPGDEIWRPSIHMPRWASRITLEITGVRVERLHGISPSDAWAEGFRCGCLKPVPACGGNIDAFSDSWESLNGPRGSSWSANPWVWVIEFKRISP